jgi:hypothetical protein
MNLRQSHPNRLNYIRPPLPPPNEFEFPGEIVYLIHSNQFQFSSSNNCQAEPCSLTDANAAKLERWAKVSKIWQQPHYLELSIHRPSAGGGIQSGKRDASIAISNASSRSCRHMNHCSLSLSGLSLTVASAKPLPFGVMCI